MRIRKPLFPRGMATKDGLGLPSERRALTPLEEKQMREAASLHLRHLGSLRALTSKQWKDQSLQSDSQNAKWKLLTDEQRKEASLLAKERERVLNSRDRVAPLRGELEADRIYDWDHGVETDLLNAKHSVERKSLGEEMSLETGLLVGRQKDRMDVLDEEQHIERVALSRKHKGEGE